jgi:hypothetical protein
MSEEKDVDVEGVPQVLHDDVMKINVDEGDALLVRLPEAANLMPRHQQQAYQQNVSHAFQDAFKDKKLKVIVMPHGMEVEIIKSSQLEDKNDDASSEAE